jgi:hypothetical protein
MAEKVKAIPVTKIARLAGGQSPTFPLPVDFKLLDGTPAQITLQCKAHKKTEWAAIRDESQRETVRMIFNPEGLAELGLAGELVPDAAPPGDDLVDTAAPQPAASAAPALDPLEMALSAIDTNGVLGKVNKALKQDAGLVLKFATGWDLEDAFTLEKIGEAENTFGGFIGNALTAYERAVYQGRLGNSD